MEKKSILSTLSVDMFIKQLKWSVWFIITMTIVYIGINLISNHFDFNFIDNIFNFSMGSSAIYMLVIGIIAGVTFLPYYVKLGVTRKDYFYGSLIAATFLSFALPIIFSLLSGLDYILTQLLDIATETNSMFNDNWFNIFITYSINIYVCYLVGWLISMGYYRFNWFIGLGFILLSVILISLQSYIWENNFIEIFEINLDISNSINIMGTTIDFSNNGSSFLLSALGSIVIITVILLIIRLITKRISIKL